MRIGYHLRLRGSATRLTGAITKVLKETFINKARRDVFLQSFWACARKKERQSPTRRRMLYSSEIHKSNSRTTGFTRVGRDYGDGQRKKDNSAGKSPSQYSRISHVDYTASSMDKATSPALRTSAWPSGRSINPGRKNVTPMFVSRVASTSDRRRKTFVIDFTDSAV